MSSIERIALHQSRLRFPGLTRDARGVALGAKGLVLFPTLDRLVAFLAVYTHERSLQTLLPQLALRVVQTPLGLREVVLEFLAESSDRMDGISDVARLVGGTVLTGTSRHFVAYRDAKAPFGYDVTELLSTDAPLALYHERFTQAYEIERSLDLRGLLTRLMLHLDPTPRAVGPRIVVAEAGLGPALIQYFARSSVEASVVLAEWPNAFDDTPVRRYVFRVPDLPHRMAPLFATTPGLSAFVPEGPGVAVESGYAHPVSLQACPVFDPSGLVLLRGRGEGAWVVERLGPMGDVRAFVRFSLGQVEPAVAVSTGAPERFRVPLRLVLSSAPRRDVKATWLRPEEIPLLRRLAYVLPRATVAAAEVAVTSRGVVVRVPTGADALAVGTFFVEWAPGVFAAAGYDLVPAVAPEMLTQRLSLRSSQVVFVVPDGTSFAIASEAFVPLETLLLEEAPRLTPLEHERIDALLTEPITLQPAGSRMPL